MSTSTSSAVSRPYDAPDSADLDALARTVDVEFFAARHTDRRGRRGPTR
nr:hypothetical protein [Rhodococcus wratislaviensis]